MPLDGNRHRDNKGLPSRSMTLGVESPKTRRMMFQRSRSGIEHHDGEVDCLNSPPTTRQNSSSDPANYLSGSREDEDSDNEDKAVPASDGVTDVLDEDEVDRTSKGVSFSTAVAEVRVRSLSVESDETSNRNEAILNAAEHMGKPIGNLSSRIRWHTLLRRIHYSLDGNHQEFCAEELG